MSFHKSSSSTGPSPSPLILPSPFPFGCVVSLDSRVGISLIRHFWVGYLLREPRCSCRSAVIVDWAAESDKGAKANTTAWSGWFRATPTLGGKRTERGIPLCQLKGLGARQKSESIKQSVVRMLFFTRSVIHGHRTLKAPHPV
jgi:hypothetical protein